MKQPEDQYTRDLLGEPGRGRPRKLSALSNAERQKRFRDRKRNENFLPLGLAQVGQLGRV